MPRTYRVNYLDKPYKKDLISAPYSEPSGRWIVAVGLVAVGFLSVIAFPVLILIALYKGYVVLSQLTRSGLSRITFGLRSSGSASSPNSKSKNISAAPGTLMLRIADFLFSPKTVELTFKTLVGDLQHEYFDALSQGKNKKAFWIRVRYLVSFTKALGLSKVIEFIRSFTTARG